MPSRRAGHFVQIFKSLSDRYSIEYVEVEGRMTSRTVPFYPSYATEGWFGVSRELSLKRAKGYAKSYRNAGFDSRVVFRGNDGLSEIVAEYKKK